MIVTVGFLLGDATKVGAEANPDVRFAIVDFAYDPAIPNVEGLVYATNEAAMILGVGGQIGQGAFAAIEERGVTGVGLGVDVDWYISVPQYKSLILTSILKKIDISVTAAVEHAFKGEPALPVYVSTLANGGVDLGPFHDYDSQISAETKAAPEDLKAKIISGEVKVSDYFAAP